jgi:hypothetical protein
LAVANDDLAVRLDARHCSIGGLRFGREAAERKQKAGSRESARTS